MAMFAELGEQLDDWLHVQNLRRIRLLRRLGLIPKPTPEQHAATEAWIQAAERLNRLAPLLSMRLDRQEWLSGSNVGTTVRFRQYGELRTATEALKDGPEHVQQT